MQIFKSCIMSLVLVLLFSSLALAGVGWGNYYVRSAGPYENTQFITGAIMAVELENASNPADRQYYRIRADLQNEMLAVALTALSSGNQVRALIEEKFFNGHWSDYEAQTLFVLDQQ